jgi:ribonuclease T2
MPMSLRRCLAVLAVVATAITSLAGSPADAQRAQAPRGGQGAADNVAGRFDYLALVLSWSPTYCAGARSDRDALQCAPRDGKRYSFVLHGLWPQHERGWPQHCPTGTRPFVPRGVIDGMLDIMPSPQLVIHQYRKHGTCSGLSAADYFKMSRRLFEKVRIPARFQHPGQAFTASPAEIMRDFLSANPGLKADQIAIACDSKDSRLTEVRVCFSRDGAFRACGRNEEARRLCRAPRLFVPPVRGTPDSKRDGRRI